MLTVYSFGPGDDDIACALFDAANRKASLDERCYAMGIDPPRYPVPAIPLKVHLEGYYPGHDIYIDSLEFGEEDPQMVKSWITWRWRGIPPEYVVEIV